MRGKGRNFPRGVRAERITPAYAGKSSASCASWGPERDHPPRMRGKAERVNVPRRFRRITPAYAGKRRLHHAADRTGGDHHRVCGEKAVLDIISCQSRGSPPRMRGKALGPSLPRIICGITTAYAGKSGCNSSSNGARWDHPRTCGEKVRPFLRMIFG